ncbi:MAG: regulatory protein RecX [Gammaproteobacteria bacterium]|nr:regulatory protein RecX [Gammaproteobacteria bacterium]NIM74970.1 regulatory protein RecX [Gammaproteobacteria bacterium]NIN39759.1 regulatory protein RecX [Gammaproteobacteria bacterium]NIO26887.1 regulatory protein RecX [Gammaproteobacteria bacterium]NIO67443.1 regulatory protein RecX [Gammaproteobacteria bacterium]
MARREHSRGELTRKLLARGFGEPAVDDALDALEAENLLSDRRFTETFVEQRIARGHGPMRIRHELRQRGIDSALACEYIDGDGSRWGERAAVVRHKRFGSDPPQDIRDRSRQTRFLAQRGFEHEHIRYALDERE